MHNVRGEERRGRKRERKEGRGNEIAISREAEGEKRDDVERKI